MTDSPTLHVSRLELLERELAKRGQSGAARIAADAAAWISAVARELEPVPVRCPGCGGPLDTSDPRRRTCSDRCRQRVRRGACHGSVTV